MTSETILSTSTIHLFGRVLEDLRLKKRVDGGRPPRLGNNRFLQNQIDASGSLLARIYAFTFEAQFYELARPTILLVHGPGTVVDYPAPEDTDLKVMSRGPSDPAYTGLSSQIGSFARGMQVWVYDKSDLTMRLELDTGTLEDVLLSAELDPGSFGRSGGAMGRSGGAMGRSGGAMGRSGGAMGRSGGAMNRGGRGDLD
ncbi:hypothetical protein EN784_44255 [bacterium M00.F.Ca.ET.141.01.1.1]|uniref:hypothetical protein n=1 Tax=unclassified Mesorhizobium TaxID=325217 RepID=UPI000FD26419|nr:MULTISPECIES: hypothetical protein [unclassified Mesorhizobium]RUW97314.1 hypothetical protein EOA30_28215 [Mesorhizobium sp. M8A.F.Ca.ET.059.01.1.1]RVD56422.1 hypothetical protein EN746_04960 [Mesorhizobium sp. M8A.F.Ca.ET.023.02.2.1]TGR38714.1 hypothetical protein EN842_44945 [bacterium M00.F.Ca.ET.199.01.1.1]TGU28177.1 hypothetical protein EN799_38820 [bacterium M00.F.Ca.ET.156.01.1.1]TGV08762.1 hypothetical protein EN816_32380 [Mesorhizobium sp. M8A.F.Ca.ET.173.01.1.1]TGV52734.1 hypoth